MTTYTVEIYSALSSQWQKACTGSDWTPVSWTDRAAAEAYVEKVRRNENRMARVVENDVE